MQKKDILFQKILPWFPMGSYVTVVELTIFLSTSYGEWVNASEEKCTSHTYGTDIIQTRSAAKTYRCSSCSKGYVEHLMETKRVCHGYDY